MHEINFKIRTDKLNIIRINNFRDFWSPVPKHMIKSSKVHIITSKAKQKINLRNFRTEDKNKDWKKLQISTVLILNFFFFCIYKSCPTFDDFLFRQSAYIHGFCRVRVHAGKVVWITQPWCLFQPVSSSAQSQFISFSGEILLMSRCLYPLGNLYDFLLNLNSWG